MRGMLLSLRRQRWWYPVEHGEVGGKAELNPAQHYSTSKHSGLLALESKARVLMLPYCPSLLCGFGQARLTLG